MIETPVRFLVATIFLSAAGLTLQSLGAAPALAQQAPTIGIHIVNADLEDFFITLKDENSRKTILDGERLNGHQRRDVDVVKDGDGHASISWSVESANGSHCKSDAASGLGVGSTVDITAGDSSC